MLGVIAFDARGIGAALVPASPRFLLVSDHDGASVHVLIANIEQNPPAHQHQHKRSSRTALLLILGTSPMVEGILAFFAAGIYGVGLPAGWTAEAGNVNLERP